jgi:putative two-component system response regulator
LHQERDGEELVLVVDDDEAARRLLVKILDRNGYRCITAGSVADARDHLTKETFSLVLTDMDMPGGSGLDLLMSIRSDHPEVATVLVSGMGDPKLAGSALDMGAFGYVTKPYDNNQILIAVANALRRRAAEKESGDHRVRLEQMIKQRMDEMLSYIGRLERAEEGMKTLQRETIQRLSLAAEFRDDDSPRHVQRVSRYCSMIAEGSGETPERCELIGTAGAMHDVGKIGIPDVILMKPGPLNDDQWETMKRHCEIGHRLLWGTNSETLDTAATVALTHHERVDGRGYPQGLKGDDIPIEGRIAAVADVFDALTSHRVYSRAVAANTAFTIMKAGRGTHFDAMLLDVFLGQMEAALEIKERYADPDPPADQLAVEEDPRRIP